MSRNTILNIVLGVICVVLLSWLFYLETSDEESAVAPTTTTSTTTSVPVTTVPETTTTSSTTTVPETTTTTTTTATTSTVPPSTEAPIERFFVGVLVVNGTSTGQRLPPVVERLNDAGYFDVRGVVGAVPVQQTTIFYAEGYRGEADVVARDLGFEPGGVEILLFDEAPPVSGRGEAKVIVYLGPDVVPELPAPDEDLADEE